MSNHRHSNQIKNASILDIQNIASHAACYPCGHFIFLSLMDAEVAVGDVDKQHSLDLLGKSVNSTKSPCWDIPVVPKAALYWAQVSLELKMCHWTAELWQHSAVWRIWGNMLIRSHADAVNRNILWTTTLNACILFNIDIFCIEGQLWLLSYLGFWELTIG